MEMSMYLHTWHSICTYFNCCWENPFGFGSVKKRSLMKSRVFHLGVVHIVSKYMAVHTYVHMYIHVYLCIPY